MRLSARFGTELIETLLERKGGIYRTKLGDMRMAEGLPVPENKNICRLSLRYGQYHLSVPYDEKLPPERENQARVVTLDPGVRSFLTWYCADSVGKIGGGERSSEYRGSARAWTTC